MCDYEEVANRTKALGRNTHVTKRCPILSVIHTWANYENEAIQNMDFVL